MAESVYMKKFGMTREDAIKDAAWRAKDPLGFGKGTLLQKLAQACGVRRTHFATIGTDGKVKPESCQTKWAYCVHTLPVKKIVYDDGEKKEVIWRSLEVQIHTLVLCSTLFRTLLLFLELCSVVEFVL